MFFISFVASFAVIMIGMWSMLEVLNIGYGYKLFLSLAFPYSGYVNSIDMANVSIHSSSNTWHFLFIYFFISFAMAIENWSHFGSFIHMSTRMVFTFLLMMVIRNLSENSI